MNGTQHYVNGTPVVNSKFPDLKALVDYGHAHKVKMGFYLNGCACGERHEHLINYQGDVELTHRLVVGLTCMHKMLSAPVHVLRSIRPQCLRSFEGFHSYTLLIPVVHVPWVSLESLIYYRTALLHRLR